MSPLFIFLTFSVYTAILFLITWITSRKSSNEGFFTGNKASPWFVVAYGMIGASLSGVTFMSVSGWVKDTQFSYMVVVFGYLVGYAVIANVLMPLYYRLNLTSIYSYLETRFGFWSYKSGSFFFLLSRTIGASLRMFLVVNVLQIFVFDSWNVPFFVTVFIFVLLIILYTFQGGIKTIIWTDTLQTTFMLLAVVSTIIIIIRTLDTNLYDIFASIFHNDNLSKIIVSDWHDKRFYVKQFFSGIFITIVMTGLDQEMMQKNLSCKNLKAAKKNMFSFSIILLFVNFMFLILGAVILIYFNSGGLALPKSTDVIFPVAALRYLGPLCGLIFLVGLISAAYPSADGALTSLTTIFCIDFLNFNKRKDISEKHKVRTRYVVHISFALILMLFIILFRSLNDKAVIDKLFTIAGYTYGPLLGMFSFGLFTRYSVKDKFVPLIVIISPVLCYFLNEFSQILFSGYRFGFELLILNGMITFAGMLCIRKYEKS